MNQVSPTMAKLVGLLNEARSRRFKAEEEFKRAADEEAIAEHEYRKAHAIAMLASEQRTEGLRQAEAELATEQLALKRRLAIGLRRSASEALKGCHDDFETLQAAFHAYNRELKTVTELEGSFS